MPIVNRDLKPGTRLVATYKKQEYWAHVVAGEDGKLHYRLEDGREFKSPSAAGSAIMAGRPCNGWRFWSLAREEATTAATAEQAGEARTEAAQENVPSTEQEPPTKLKAGRTAKAEANTTVDVECRCLSYQPGSQGCKLEESGDCQPV